MNKAIWKSLIAALPPNLKIEQAARILNRKFSSTRRHLILNGYEFKPERSYETPVWVKKADWRMSNIAIGRKFGLSRERVRQLRVKLGKPFVESRGRKPGKKNGSQNGHRAYRSSNGKA